MEYIVDNNGTWLIDGDGIKLLVEPSEAWIQENQNNVIQQMPSQEERLQALENAFLAMMEV